MSTPLQHVVSVICDSLADLPPGDQERALEAVAVTLGIRPPSQLPRVAPNEPYRMVAPEPFRPSLVVSPPPGRADRAVVNVMPIRSRQLRDYARDHAGPHRALPAPRDEAPTSGVRLPYIRPLR